jgi:hypothetical protein
VRIGNLPAAVVEFLGSFDLGHDDASVIAMIGGT